MLDDFTQTIHQPIWPKRWHATGLNRSKIKEWLIAFVPSNVHTKYYQRNDDSFIHSMTKDRNSCATAENLVESYDHWCDHMHIELWCIIRNIVQGVYGVIAVNFGIYSFSSCIQIRFFSKCYSCILYKLLTDNALFASRRLSAIVGLHIAQWTRVTPQQRRRQRSTRGDGYDGCHVEDRQMRRQPSHVQRESCHVKPHSGNNKKQLLKFCRKHDLLQNGVFLVFDDR